MARKHNVYHKTDLETLIRFLLEHMTRLEILYGSFELTENVDKMVDAGEVDRDTVNWFLDGFTPEERAERQAQCDREKHMLVLQVKDLVDKVLA